jgi:hypothetical protein
MQPNACYGGACFKKRSKKTTSIHINKGKSYQKWDFCKDLFARTLRANSRKSPLGLATAARLGCAALRAFQCQIMLLAIGVFGIHDLLKSLVLFEQFRIRVFFTMTTVGTIQLHTFHVSVFMGRAKSGIVLFALRTGIRLWLRLWSIRVTTCSQIRQASFDVK